MLLSFHNHYRKSLVVPIQKIQWSITANGRILKYVKLVYYGIKHEFEDLTFNTRMHRYPTMKTKPIPISIHHHCFVGDIRLVSSVWKKLSVNNTNWKSKRKRNTFYLIYQTIFVLIGVVNHLNYLSLII